MKYVKLSDGDRFLPVKRNWRMMCCDCGLVHRFNFRTFKRGNGTRIEMWGKRDERATAAARRAKQKVMV